MTMKACVKSITYRLCIKAATLSRLILSHLQLTVLQLAGHFADAQNKFDKNTGFV